MRFTAKEVVFGHHAIIEAILAGRDIAKILVQNTGRVAALRCKLLELAKAHGIPCSSVPLAKLNSLTGKRHQGVIAFLSPIGFANLPNIIQGSYEQGKSPLVILLDGVSDVRNVGAIARSAVSTGVDALIVPTKHTAAINALTMKTSAGGLAHLPVCRVAHLQQALQYLKDSGLQIIACSHKAEKMIYQANFKLPTALLIGGEERGIASKHLRMADDLLKIPMQGPIASLNVSVATAVFLYEVVRQRL